MTITRQQQAHHREPRVTPQEAREPHRDDPVAEAHFPAYSPPMRPWHPDRPARYSARDPLGAELQPLPLCPLRTRARSCFLPMRVLAEVGRLLLRVSVMEVAGKVLGQNGG